MTQSFDRRLTPARPDLAAKHLEGQVSAARFVEGVVMQVKEGVVDVKREPRPDAPLETQAIYGDCVTVYDDEEGWCWGQLASDGYVGWIAANALWSRVEEGTHVVRVARSFVYPAANMKAPAILALPLGASVRVIEQRDAFLATSDGGFLYAKHLLPIGDHAGDFVAVAETLIGVPYLWGGKSSTRDRLLGSRPMRLSASRNRRAARQRFAAGGAGTPRHAARTVAARRSRLLERPCRDHARRLDTAARQCHAYARRVRALRGGARAQSGRGRRRRDGDQAASGKSRRWKRMTLYLEDLSVGQSFRSESRVLAAEEIIRFARDNDPQYFHIDPEAAKGSLFGGLVASGWQTAALSMRLLVEGPAPFAGGLVGMNADLSWTKPVRPGDSIRIEAEVTQISRSRSRPDRGIVSLRLTTFNQREEPVQKIAARVLVFARTG